MSEEENTEGTEEAAAEASEEESKPAGPVADPRKVALKARIADLKGQRAAAIDSKDGAALKRARRRIRGLKRQIRKLPAQGAE